MPRARAQHCDPVMAAFGVMAPGGDPPLAPLAPVDADGEVVWTEVCRLGVPTGPVAVEDAPAAVASAYRRADPGWVTALTGGAGVALRYGKGAPRGDGTRPRVAYLDPCTSAVLRAHARDDGFTATGHHVVMWWSIPTRSGRAGFEGAWCWSSEHGPDTDGAAAIIVGPTRIGARAAAALLARPPDAAAIAAAHREARAVAAALLGEQFCDRGGGDA